MVFENLILKVSNKTSEMFLNFCYTFLKIRPWKTKAHTSSWSFQKKNAIVRAQKNIKQ